ncbi:hypothetical protein R5R35_007051 [Gryllus longicercus]|uniref:Cytochrome P450 n=1 Tax=Gryllus longicercus TaxID=2509291 RepID=A0AAN9VD45_9ORTH
MAIIFESFLTDLLVGTLTLFGLVYWYFTKDFDYWQKRNIAFVKPLPFFGNFKGRLTFTRAISDIWVDIYKELKHHKIGGTWVINKPFLVINDPDIIRRVLVKDFAHFHDRGMPVDEERNPLSLNLFNLAGTQWRSLRAKLTPTFTSGKMKLMFSLMHECAREFVEFVAQETRVKKDVEFREMFAKMTTDIIGTTAFGLQFNSMKNPDSEFRAMGRRVFSPSKWVLVGQILYHFFPPVGKLLNMQFPEKDISDFFMKAVKDTVDYREKNNVKRNDFLQLLIELKNKRKIEEDAEKDSMITAEGLAQESELKNFEMSDNLLAAQAFVFFLAGFETSSTTMSFALHELTMNPDVQTKLREEVDRVLEEHGGELSYDALKNMEYLDKVINETLRKYPPIPTLMRKCTKDYHETQTGKYIEEGTQIEIPVYALHHDPEYYPDPQRFDPERFSDEQRATRPNYVYLPFGEGPRICIGMRFGLLQAKLGLAALVSRFELAAAPQTAPPALDPKAFITSFRGGVWARVKARRRIALAGDVAGVTDA